MKVSNRKGIANQSVPESCVAHREVCDEALTGEPAGQPSSRESDKLVQGADVVSVTEGNTDRRVSASGCPTLRGLRTWHVGTLPSPLAQCALRRHPPKAGARCANRARRDMCGGSPVTGGPIAIRIWSAPRPRALSRATALRRASLPQQLQLPDGRVASRGAGRARRRARLRRARDHRRVLARRRRARARRGARRRSCT